MNEVTESGTPCRDFEAFFREFWEVLVRLAGARMKTRDRSAAEDVAQEVMIKAAQSFTKLRRRDAAIGWLSTILKNVLATRYRNTAKKPEWFNLEEHDPAARDTTAQVPDWLLPHLRGLPGAQGELIDALEECGCNRTEAALRLGIKERTVDATLSKVSRHVLDSLEWGYWIRFRDAHNLFRLGDPVVPALIKAKSKENEGSVWQRVLDALIESGCQSDDKMERARLCEMSAIIFNNVASTFAGPLGCLVTELVKHSIGAFEYYRGLGEDEHALRVGGFFTPVRGWLNQYRVQNQFEAAQVAADKAFSLLDERTDWIRQAATTPATLLEPTATEPPSQ